MKALTLIRHAKSSWKDPSLPDLLRPLNKRGRRESPAMGARLAQGAFEADAFLCSPATRALATAERIAPEISYPVDEIIIVDRLYGASCDELTGIIEQLDDTWGSVVLLGHNPGLSELVDHISPHLVGNLPTCGIVRFVFGSGPWHSVLDTEPVEATFDSPRKAGLR